MEAPARAAKAKKIVEAQALAEQIRIEAEAQAAAIYAKLEAEARGQYEVLAKKGEGLQRIVEACGGATEAFQMLMLEHLDKLAETSAQAISNIKFDKVVVWENGGHNGRGSTANFLSGMSRTLPPMLQVLKDVGGVEIPESLIRFTDSMPSDAPEAGDGQVAATQPVGSPSEEPAPEDELEDEPAADEEDEAASEAKATSDPRDDTLPPRRR